MTQETLREAVRAAYERGFNSVPTIAAILPDGTPAAHWAGLDAAIATMLERLRTPSEGMAFAGANAEAVEIHDADSATLYPCRVWQAMLDKCKQENSDGR